MTMVGVDTGGTFTDLISINQAGEIIVIKVPSIINDQSLGVVNSLKVLPESHKNADYLVHGTTVATYALVQRSGARTLLITTENFRDIIEIGRQNRVELYTPPYRPPSLVLRSDRIGAKERVDSSGNIIEPFDSNDLEKKLLLWQNQNDGHPPDSVAISYLFSFTNDFHEIQTANIVRNMWPTVAISFSSQVLPVFREYERTLATVMDAYVSPVLKKYLFNLDNHVKEFGIPNVYILQSNTGIASPKNVQPSYALLSGLAGGELAGIYTEKVCNIKYAVTIDIGGTSTEVSLIKDQQISITTTNTITGFPIRIPSIDVITIGAGGGSIAYKDIQGLLKVGPQSTGAYPGPACYGNDFIPCVTDADLFLGLLNPKKFAGGLPLYPDRAEKALEELGKTLGLGVMEVARGIEHDVHTKIGLALRTVSIERGVDPRTCALIAFGGAGPTHACPLAELLDIPKILVPLYPGAWSAFGLLCADFRYDYSKTVLISANDLSNANLEKIEDIFSSFESSGREKLRNDGFIDANIVLERSVDVRYHGQSYELTLSIPKYLKKLEKEFLNNFHILHEQRYGYSIIDEEIELVNVRLTATGKVVEPKLSSLATGGTRPPEYAYTGSRKIILEQGEPISVPVIDRHQLLVNNVISEPTILEQSDTTTIIHPEWQATVLSNGHIQLQRKK